MDEASSDAWVYLHDPATGCSYYADTVTGTTTWERPAVLDAPPESSLVVAARRVSFAADRRRSRSKSVAAKWVEYFDETQGLPYYHNEATGESAWVLPADDDEDEDADEEEPSHLVEEDVARREKALRHRERILEEIITTEQSYVANLHVLMKVYLHPLRMVANVPRGAIFSHDDLDAIFLNIELITKVNDQFLAELLSGVSPADALKAAAKQFKGVYTRCARSCALPTPRDAHLSCLARRAPPLGFAPPLRQRV